MTNDLDATVDEYHRALDSFVTGDPSAAQALFSRREDVTLANPFGPPQLGRPAIEETTARAAEHYRDGRALGFDRVSGQVTGELAYLVEIEHYEARLDGSDTVTPFSLRVTTVFRLEDDGWRIAHRHADGITTPRGAESVTQS